MQILSRVGVVSRWALAMSQIAFTPLGNGVATSFWPLLKVAVCQRSKIPKPYLSS